MKKEWKIFVKEMNKHGNYVQAYKKAYPSAKPTTCRVSGYKLTQKPTIASELRRYNAKIEAIATQRAAEELKNEIKIEVLTAERKKEILRLIAEGKEMQKEYKPELDEETNKMVPKLVAFKSPTILDRIKAIEVHNKMTGDEMPQKIDHLNSDGSLKHDPLAVTENKLQITVVNRSRADIIAENTGGIHET